MFLLLTPCITERHSDSISIVPWPSLPFNNDPTSQFKLFAALQRVLCWDNLEDLTKLVPQVLWMYSHLSISCSLFILHSTSKHDFHVGNTFILLSSVVFPRCLSTILQTTTDLIIIEKYDLEHTLEIENFPYSESVRKARDTFAAGEHNQGEVYRDIGTNGRAQCH